MKLKIKFSRDLQVIDTAGFGKAYTPSGGAVFPTSKFQPEFSLSERVLIGPAPERVATKGNVTFLYYEDVIISLRKDVFTEITLLW